MRAAVCRSYGAPETVRIEDIPPPEPGVGHVRVAVHAAAVNFADVLVIANRYQASAPTPFVPGSEFAGVVRDVGEGVRGFGVGDRVIGTAFVGAFAQQAVVDAAAVTATPAGVDDHLAAAFGVAHRTAYHVLRSVARLRAGDELVVLGAGGGVGLAAVQIGALLGATVTAVASTPDKLAVAESRGARNLIAHRSTDLRAALRKQVPDGAHVVVDPVGGGLAEPALRSLRWGGRFVTVGYASGVIPRIPLNLVLLKGIQILGFQFRDFAALAPEEYRRNEQELLGLLAARRVDPHIQAVYGFDDVVAALRHVADGHAIGKVLLDVPG